MSCWDADHFCIMTRATDQAGCSRERPRFTSTARVSITSWFRLFQNTKSQKIGRSGNPEKAHGEDNMGISRRGFVTAVAGIGLSSVAARSGAWASDGPIRIGLLTVKTGALASGGIDMERALNMFLKERDYTMSGRKVELVTGDTGGVPATARSKTQEMVEKK